MFSSLPQSGVDFMDWSWSQIEPYYQDLQNRQINAENVNPWLLDWTRIMDLNSERYARLNLAVTQDTTDKEAEARYNDYLDTIHPAAQSADQGLKEKLLASGLEPDGFWVPLRKMRADAAIYRPENLPLLSQERKLASQYNKIVGAQTVTWEGEEVTLQQLRKVIQDPDREVRQRAWELAAGRQLADREAINRLWGQFMDLRGELAANAGQPSYRAYRWQQLHRLDYTPEDCFKFQEAIEEVAVTAATRVYARQARRLGVDRLRPWDLDLELYPLLLPALPPYGDEEALQSGAEKIFEQVHPLFGSYFHTMRGENLLDLENRKGKAPGAYCTSFQHTKRPFVFMNAVGLSGDVRTLLHESGHAFHNFERLDLSYSQQRHPGLEFSEVASMGMELLASPYLIQEQGGFYSPADAARFRVQHLEHILCFWPYMAVVDAFQHWVYTHHQTAREPQACDATWLELWERFLPGVDWSGLEDEAMTGWHRKLHIHRYPFYYVEYGIAQLGAVQVWRNALRDQENAVAAYRQALALGGTETLPQLFAAAGAHLSFDAATLQEAVSLIETTIDELES
jgi:oligoendopeptidase F